MVKGAQNKMSKGKGNAMAFYDLFNDAHRDKGVQLGKLTKTQNGWSFTITSKNNTKLKYPIPLIEHGTARLYKLKQYDTKKGLTSNLKEGNCPPIAL